MIEVDKLPTLNAILNFISACLLLRGWWAIRIEKDRARHIRFMVTALVSSSAFLTSYLIYHFNAEMMTVYPGTGWMKWFYYTVLATHVPLAALIVPGIGYIVWNAYKGRFEKHKKFARIVFPAWMYVSVTGVIIYCMLYL